MKRFWLSMLLLLITLGAMANVRFPAITFTTTLQDGRTVSYRVMGDTRLSFLKTTDGEHIVQDGEAFRLATEAEHAKLLADIDSINALIAKESQPLQTRAMLAETGTQDGGKLIQLPHFGKPKIIVILVDFEDRKMTFGKKDFEQLFNGTEYATLNADGTLPEYVNYGSVRQYFRDSSHGKFEPIFDVTEVYHLSGNASSYIQGGAIYGDDFRKILAAADDDVDFSQYDLVCVMCAGYQWQYTFSRSDISACTQRNRDNYATLDGKDIDMFFVGGELGLNPSFPTKCITPIGTICHELGHALGLADYYPTDYSWDDFAYNNQGMEFWDLMDAACHLAYGYCPTPLSYFNRWLLGWVDEPLQVEADRSYFLYPIDDEREAGRAMRVINPEDPNEYWVLENIPQWSATDNMGKEEPGALGWYLHAPSYGLLVTHVRYEHRYFELGLPNQIAVAPNNTPSNPRITIIPADGLLMNSMLNGLSIDDDILDDARTDTYPLLGEGDAKSRYTVRLDLVNKKVLPDSSWVETFVEAKEISALQLKASTWSPDLLSIMDIQQLKKNGAVTFSYRKHPDAEKQLTLHTIDEEEYYTTFYSDHLAYHVPEGAVAYQAQLNTEDYTLTLEELSADIIPAGHAVILKTTQPGTNNTMTLYQANNCDYPNGENVLEGVESQTAQDPDYNYYVLSSTAEHGLGFFQLSKNLPLAANKAFIKLPAAAKTRAITFAGNNNQANTISTVGLQSSADAIYNFSGQRISSPQRGLNIINGKKVITR